MLIDTHLHIIDKSALEYPWLAATEALNRDFLYETYEREARRVGIQASLHIEADVAPRLIEQENDYVAGLAGQDDSLIVGAISSARPEEKGFAAFLERQQQNPLVKGFRRVLHVMPDDLSESPLFRENLKRLSGTGLTFDLCVLPHQLPKAIELVDLAPDVQFILDHCGAPDIKGGGLASWSGHIGDIAKRSNVVAKVSGVIAYADPENWTLSDLRPYLEHTVECFGFDRLVWGSNWPVGTPDGGGLATWIAVTQALFNGCTASERARFYRENAKRLWGLSVAT